MIDIVSIFGGLTIAALLILLAYFSYIKPARARIDKIESEMRAARDQAEREIETKKKEILLEAKDKAHELRAQVERENREKRAETQRLERRLAQKEETLDRRLDNLDRKEKSIAEKEVEANHIREELEGLAMQEREQLQRISGMTSEQAKDMLLHAVERESEREAAKIIREYEERAREDGERKARDIVTMAIQRCAVDQAAETTVSVVPLPGDDMKGRIIGREGRNIRAFETLTGVDLIIDDTPEAVVISGFDAVRREIARIALGNLILDGRIHPGRIEEVILKAQADVENRMKEAADQAVFETGVTGLDPEIMKLLGRLKYRTSYGQNVLDHSIEVSHLAGTMAVELGVNVLLAKRAGLLHDIGKAVDFEVEGPHAVIGMDILKRFHEPADIIHAAGAHHNDVEPHSIEAVLVLVADAISASRPGARRETLETYVKRLQKLETIADSFDGVEKTYAVQAGREIRVMVKPTEIDDLGATKLARDTAKRIEDEMEYPGQIKVTVIRETRAVDYAK